MRNITLDSSEVAARIAAAIDESSAEMRNLEARATEMAALSASIDVNQLRATDAETVERIEALSHAVLYHAQAHLRLVRELTRVCEFLGHPVAVKPRLGVRSAGESATGIDAVGAPQSLARRT